MKNKKKKELKREQEIALGAGAETVTVTPKDLSQRRPTAPAKALETFANPNPKRHYEVRFDCPEFTCL